MKTRTYPVFLAFLCMGFADAVGPFVSLAKAQFSISTALASLIPFVGFMMFGLLSVPVGLYQDRKGKKFILLFGLVVGLIGMAVASLALDSFPVFLMTILMLGASAAILQVAGNPIMRDVSPEGKYSRNLSLGQFVKAIGSLSGPVIPVVASRWLGLDWRVIFPVYAAGMLITLIAVAGLRVEETRRPDEARSTLGSALGLLRNGYVAMMVLGIFLYVGAEVCVSAGTPLLLKANFGIDIARLGLLGTGLFFTALTIGRFSGGVIMNWLSPQKTFIGTCLVSLLGLAGLFVQNRLVAGVSVFVVGLGFANIFPLIFSIAVDRMPEHSNSLSGLMVTAIAGGAVLPLVMGLVTDRFNESAGFLVPLAALLYITFVAVKNLSAKYRPGKEA
jgi:fucose permease